MEHIASIQGGVQPAQTVHLVSSQNKLDTLLLLLDSAFPLAGGVSQKGRFLHQLNEVCAKDKEQGFGMHCPGIPGATVALCLSCSPTP